MAEQRQQESIELDGLPLEVLIAAEGRRQSYDQMMWQVPGLSLTAQSFLLTIALGSSSTPVARFASGLLAFIAALATIQLLLKQRYAELEWSLWLDRATEGTVFTRIWGRRASKAYAWHGSDHRWERSVADQMRWARERRPPGRKLESAAIRAFSPIAIPARARMAVRSSVNVWTLTLTIFALADLIAAGYGVHGLLC
jgi:hypothetical protein